MSCCAKGKKGSHKGCTEKKDGCCDDRQCNPFFSQCPICAANAVVVKKYILPHDKPVLFTNPEFFLKNDQVISHYQADILRPPQFVRPEWRC